AAPCPERGSSLRIVARREPKRPPEVAQLLIGHFVWERRRFCCVVQDANELTSIFGIDALGTKQKVQGRIDVSVPEERRREPGSTSFAKHTAIRCQRICLDSGLRPAHLQHICETRRGLCVCWRPATETGMVWWQI